MADFELDAYEIIGVESTATSTEIQKAYRKRSLKLHPDKNPNDPEAPQRFHDLQECLNLLLDPIKRAAFDQKVRARLATKARTAAFDLKRKAGVDELSRREEAYKRFKQDERKKEVDKANEMERLKSESGKLMQERKLAQEKARKEEVERQRAQERAMADAGPLDTAIKIKWPRKRFKQFDDQSALSSLLQPFGTIDSILLSSKFLTNPGVKTGSAVVSFKTVDEAAKVIKKAAIEGSPFEGMTVSWAAGAPPASLSSFPATQEEPATVDADSPSVGSFPFASNPDDLLERLRLRQREIDRKKLEEEIRKQDALEDDTGNQGP